MKKIRWIIAGLLAVLPWTGMAADHVYFQNNLNYPMIVNTEGIYTVGNNGIFMNLSSIELEDIFKNGMAVKASFLQVNNEEARTFTEHFRMADDGRAWMRMQDGWHAVTSDSSGAERMAVSLIREDMGNEEKRMGYTAQITAIWDAKVKAYEIKKAAEEKARREEMTEEEIEAEEKKETTEDYRSVELGEVEPEIVQKGDAHPIVRKVSTVQNEENPANSNGAVKIKGQVQKQKESKDKNEKPEQVEIVITGNPVVEIIPSKQKT